MRLASIGTAKALLDLNDDVLYLICVQVHEDDQLAAGLRPRDRPPRWLHRLSMSCKRLRGMASPLLYRKVTYTEDFANSRCDPSPKKFLDILESSDMYRKRIRILNIDSEDRFEEGDCLRLIGLLPTLLNLETLKLILPRERMHVLRALSGKRVPAIKTLTLSLHYHPVATSFPYTKSIRIENPYLSDDLIPPFHFLGLRPAQQSSTIQHLDIRNLSPEWNHSLLRYLATSFPQLRHLGTLNWLANYGGRDRYRYEYDIRSLSHFTLLKTLRTEEFKYLDASHWKLEDPFSECDECGWEIWDPLPCEIHREEALYRVLRLAFEAYATLQEVWVRRGGVVRCERDAEGRIWSLARFADAIPPNPFG